jgi:hypothetical protein
MNDDARSPNTNESNATTDESQPHARGLVEPEGVNAGSAAGERDRRASAVPPSHAEAVTGDVERDAPPPAEAVGLPSEPFGVPGQQLEAGEG